MKKVSLLTGGLIVALSSAAPALQAQAWNAYTANNSGEYWDNISGDGNTCNIGFIAAKIAGTPGNSCNYQTPMNWLPYTGTNMTANLNNGGAFTPFQFAAGTYRFRQAMGLGGSVAGGNQPFGYFTRNGAGVVTLTQVFPSTSSFDITVTFTTTWGLFVDELGPNPMLSYSDMTANPYFALFTGVGGASRALGSGTSGSLTYSIVNANIGDDFLAGFGDQSDGDKDIQDKVLYISSTVIPEPSTYVLMATGLAGLVGVARRRRTV